jgi:hypothetical protein
MSALLSKLPVITATGDNAITGDKADDITAAITGAPNAKAATDDNADATANTTATTPIAKAPNAAKAPITIAATANTTATTPIANAAATANPDDASELTSDKKGEEEEEEDEDEEEKDEEEDDEEEDDEEEDDEEEDDEEEEEEEEEEGLGTPAQADPEEVNDSGVSSKNDDILQIILSTIIDKFSDLNDDPDKALKLVNKITFDSSKLTHGNTGRLVDINLTVLSQFLKKYVHNDVTDLDKSFLPSYNTTINTSLAHPAIETTPTGNAPASGIIVNSGSNNIDDGKMTPHRMTGALLSLFEEKNRLFLTSGNLGTPDNNYYRIANDPITIPRDSRNPLLNSCFSGTGQLDAVEFLQYILENLPDDIKTFNITYNPSLSTGTGPVTEDEVRQIGDRFNAKHLIRLAVTTEPEKSIINQISNIDNVIFSNNDRDILPNFQLNSEYVIFTVQPIINDQNEIVYEGEKDREGNVVPNGHYIAPITFTYNHNFMNSSYKCEGLVLKYGKTHDTGHYIYLRQQDVNNDLSQHDVLIYNDKKISILDFNEVNKNITNNLNIAEAMPAGKCVPIILIYKKVPPILVNQPPLAQSVAPPLAPTDQTGKKRASPLIRFNVGLDNTQNTCAINAVIQSLWYNDELYEALQQFILDDIVVQYNEASMQSATEIKHGGRTRRTTRRKSMNKIKRPNPKTTKQKRKQ